MIKDVKAWENQVKINNGPYGKAVIDVTRRVMEILDEDKDFEAHDIISRANKEVECGGGITGFQSGCLAQIVIAVHSRGEEFRKKFNKSHGVDDNDSNGGVVNPAILTITTEDTQ